MTFKRILLIHADHDVPLSLIRQALTKIESEKESGQHIVDFNRIIGFNELVEVTDDEEFYEQVRNNRAYPSRYVKNRLPIPTSKLVVIWQRINTDIIRVISAYYTGRNDAHCPDEPGNILRKIAKGATYTEEQITEAYEFWSTHAFVEPIPRYYALNK